MASEPLAGSRTHNQTERGRLARLGQLLPVDWARVRDITNETVPGHIKRWWFALGGTPGFLFLVQIATGILLSFYYVPSPDHAYESVRTISTTLPYGWFIRSIHKWAANLMIVTVLLHMLRVYFSCGFRHPRQLNWVIGCGLLVGTLTLGFTGYALVYEQLSYWGVTVAAELTSVTPLVGDTLAWLMRGGEQVGPNTLLRMYNLHVHLLPVAIVFLIVLHIALLRLHGVSDLSFDEAPVAGGSPGYAPAPERLGVRLVVVLAAFVAVGCLFIGALDPINVRLLAHELAPESCRIFWLITAALFATAAILLYHGHLYGLMLWLFISALALGKLVFDLANHEAPSRELWILGALVLTAGIVYGTAQHRHFDESKSKDQPFSFFPDHVLTELMIGMLLLFLLTLLSLVFPAGLAEKANPLVTPEHIKPEWYFFFQFHLLKLTGLNTAVLLTGLILLLIVVWPWIDVLLERIAPGKDLGVYVGIVAFLMFLLFTVWEAMG